MKKEGIDITLHTIFSGDDLLWLLEEEGEDPVGSGGAGMGTTRNIDVSRRLTVL